MQVRNVPSRNQDGKFVRTTYIQSIRKDHILLFDEIIVRRFRLNKLELSDDFLNAVIPETIRLLAVPYNSSSYSYIQYYLDGNSIYINTNAYSNEEDLSWKYVRLQIVISGERWDTEVINDIINDLGDYEK